MAEARKTNIGIGFQVDYGPLKEADESVDELKEKSYDTGDAFQEMGGDMADAGDDMQASIHDTGDSFDDLGTEIDTTGDEMQNTFQETTDEVENLGDAGVSSLGNLKGAMQGVMATGFSAYIANAAANLETARFRADWFAEDSQDNFKDLQNSIDNTVEMSQGLHAEGDLLEAANQAMKMGTDLEVVNEHMEALAIQSARTGEDLTNIMEGVGRAIEMGTIRRLQRMGIIQERHFHEMGENVTQSIRDWDRHRREQLLNVALQDTVNQHQDKYNEYLETTQAQLGILWTQLGNIAEIMGEPIIGPLATFTDYISDILIYAQEDPFGQYIIKGLGLATILGTLAIGAKGLATALGFIGITSLKTVIPGLAGILIPAAKFIAIGAGLFLLVQDLIYAFGGLGDSLTERAFDAFMEFIGIEYTFQEFRDQIISIGLSIGQFFVGLWDWIVAVWNEGEGGIGRTISGIIEIVRGGLQIVASIIGWVAGFLTGNFELMEDSGWLLLEGLGNIFGGIYDVMVGNIETGLDFIVEGFKALPGNITDAIGDLGGKLKTKFTEALDGVRNMLPFSPPKEGPLKDIQEAGGEIIGQINTGLDKEEFKLHETLEHDINKMDAPESYYTPEGDSIGKEIINIVLNNNVDINVDGTADDIDEEYLINEAIRRLKANGKELVNEVFEELELKKPRVTER